MLILLLTTLSFALTYILKHYAIKRNVVDIPNARSSHTIPTPRGGGVAFVFTFLLFLLITYIDSSDRYLLILFFSSLFIAVIGFIDDLIDLSAKIRLIAHFITATFIAIYFDGFPVLTIFDLTVELGVIGILLSTLFCVWMLNLYNFMDGINGIAGMEGVFVSLIMALFSFVILSNIELSVMFLALSGSCLGFLVWNFPYAKIFMGDAGSSFLGFTFASLILYSSNMHPELFWCWLILLGVFIVDSTYTLLTRIGLGCKPFEAHNTHCYQKIAKQCNSHIRAVLYIVTVNVFWLAPLALLSVLYPNYGAAIMFISYIPLILIAIKFKAGENI